MIAPGPDAASPELDARAFGDRVATLVADGATVLTLVGTDDRGHRGDFGLHALLLRQGRTIALDARLPERAPRYPSITPRVPALQWDERELRDLLGIVPDGHPDPRRLILRAEWPDGLYPLRKDFDPARAPPLPSRDSFPARTVEGDEIVEIPVGPIHAGIIEPGHFRFSAVGETILRLDAQLFYTHRGIEKIAEGRRPESALAVVERTCGACAASHAVAFATAVEQIAGYQIPRRAAWARTLLLELERLYNHFGDAGNMCAGGALAVGTMVGAAMKEQVQRRIERLVGHRFLRGAVAIGGLRRDLPSEELDALRSELPRWRTELDRFTQLVLGSEGFVNRLRGTGILQPEVVRALGGVGVLARASGVDVDLRRDRPYLLYDELLREVPLQSAGDAEARLRQRIDEALATLDLLARLLATRPDGPVRSAIDPLPAWAVGVGAVESPRGADVHWVRIDDRGLIDRVRIRSASFPNWAIVPLAVPGNLVPDFPMINKSFELCYSCLDR